MIRQQAHARSTNYYEVDLIEALLATGDTDPNEAFRYWWLLFRPEAYRGTGSLPVQTADSTTGWQPVPRECWLDAVLQGSRDYAKRLGDRLKDRVFLTIFPHLAHGFLEDRKKRLEIKSRPTEDELSEVFEANYALERTRSSVLESLGEQGVTVDPAKPILKSVFRTRTT